MIFEDYERDHLKEMIYLQEEEEILAAEIKVIKDESKDNIQEVREVNPARIYVGYDLPFENDPRRFRCVRPVLRNSKTISTLSNDSQETVNH